MTTGIVFFCAFLIVETIVINFGWRGEVQRLRARVGLLEEHLSTMQRSLVVQCSLVTSVAETQQKMAELMKADFTDRKQQATVIVPGPGGVH